MNPIDRTVSRFMTAPTKVGAEVESRVYPVVIVDEARKCGQKAHRQHLQRGRRFQLQARNLHALCREAMRQTLRRRRSITCINKIKKIATWPTQNYDSRNCNVFLSFPQQPVHKYVHYQWIIFPKTHNSIFYFLCQVCVNRAEVSLIYYLSFNLFNHSH